MDKLLILHNKVDLTPQFSLLPESGDQLGAAADVPQLAASERTELGDILGGEVGQAVLLEVAPNIFGGIEFGSVSRQRGDINASLEALKVFPNEPAPMDHGSVSDDQHFAGQLSLEVVEELDDLWTFDGTRVKLEIEIPDRAPADNRKLLPVEVKFQHWGFPARGPSAHPVGFLAQAALINEDNDPVFSQVFFLRRGQVVCFQRRMTRVVGRWQVQPICPSKRPTWSGWYAMPKGALMIWATRWVVHSSVGKLCSPRTALRARLSTGQSCCFSRGARQALGVSLRPHLPLSPQPLCQRLANWQETRSCRATSAGASSLSNRVTTFHRRHCSAIKSPSCPLGQSCKFRQHPLKYVHYIM